MLRLVRSPRRYESTARKIPSCLPPMCRCLPCPFGISVPSAGAARSRVAMQHAARAPHGNGRADSAAMAPAPQAARAARGASSLDASAYSAAESVTAPPVTFFVVRPKRSGSAFASLPRTSPVTLIFPLAEVPTPDASSRSPPIDEVPVQFWAWTVRAPPVTPFAVASVCRKSRPSAFVPAPGKAQEARAGGTGQPRDHGCGGQLLERLLRTRARIAVQRRMRRVATCVRRARH